MKKGHRKHGRKAIGIARIYVAKLPRYLKASYKDVVMTVLMGVLPVLIGLALLFKLRHGLV